jgi:mannose-1-phosphate guanylyltransferase
MFFFTARSMLSAIAEHMPELHAGLDRIGSASGDQEAQRRVTRAVFEGLESVSIDYGVMEKMQQLNVVPASFGWSDLGDWASAWEMSAHDAHGNQADCELVSIDAHRNLVRTQSGQSKLVALVGVDDLCVIETGDVLLVMPRERAQDVKKAVDELARRGRGDLL